MKLNFWQWLGAIIFVLGLIFLIARETGKSGQTQSTQTTPAPAAPTTSNVPATTMTSP
jgi:drug/metabolite transporter (DMT)-like permease